jgi:hypothetical protein
MMNEFEALGEEMKTLILSWEPRLRAMPAGRIIDYLWHFKLHLDEITDLENQHQ